MELVTNCIGYSENRFNVEGKLEKCCKNLKEKKIKSSWKIIKKRIVFSK